MACEVSFIIPWRESGDEHRQKSYEWNLRRLVALFPNAQICIGSDDTPNFNRAAARNDAIRQAECDFVASVDADTVWNIETLELALAALENDAHWVIPYSEYRALDDTSTERVLTLDPATHIDPDVYTYERIKKEDDPDLYPPISGLTVFRREDLYTIGGFDESFVGWGFEDTAFWITADKILGPHVRLHGNVYHLWHPRGDADVHQPNYQENWRHFDEYVGNFETTHKKFL